MCHRQVIEIARDLEIRNLAQKLRQHFSFFAGSVMKMEHEDEDESAILARQLTVGERIAAARIVAGFSQQNEAAERVGISNFSLNRLETRAANPDAETVDAIARTFGVSVDYINYGVAKTETDEIAKRIALAIQSLPELDAPDTIMAERLRQARMLLGFKSAAAAAQALGHKVPTYIGHESGARRMPYEKAALYALQLKVRPEHVLLAQGNTLPAASDPVLRWAPVQDAQGPITNSASWRWLRKRKTEPGLSFPVVRVADGGFELADQRPMRIPPALVPSALRELDSPVYGVVVGKELWIVNPSTTSGKVVSFDNGKLATEAFEGSKFGFNVLQNDGVPDNFILGLFMGAFGYNPPGS